jgi:hypothetical protein
VDYSSIVPKRMIADGTHTPYTRWLLVIDGGGEVSLADRTYYGGDGTFEDEWNDRTLAYEIAGPGVIDTDLLREDLAEGGVLSTLIDRVKAGHEVVWDGNNNVGHLDEDAQEASDELERLLGDDDGAPLYIRDDMTVWDTAEWIEGGGVDDEAILADVGLLAESDPAGEAVKEAARRLRSSAESDGVHLTGSVVEYLGELIERVRAAREVEAEEAAAEAAEVD